MIKFSKLCALGIVTALLSAAPAMAQEPADAAPSGAFSAADGSAISFSGAIGAGVTVIGAAYGIG